MDLMKLGTELLMDKLSNRGANASQDNIVDALTSLLGGSDGNLDLGGLVSKFMGNSDLAGIAASWLGDGENEQIGADQIKKTPGYPLNSSHYSMLYIKTFIPMANPQHLVDA